MRRYLYGAVMILVTALVTVIPAPTASAGCPDQVGTVWYTFTNKKTSRILSNLRSAYLVGPGTIIYNESKTATANASLTATVSAEAGIVLAKASTSLGVQVGKSWSKSGSWTYSKPVPRGKTARLVMYHESRSFTVTKKKIVAPCHTKVLYKANVKAPRTANLNTWDLQNK